MHALRCTPALSICSSNAAACHIVPSAGVHYGRRCACKSLQAPKSARKDLDARGLSYLGDAVWTLCVRSYLFTPPKHWKTYQDMVLLWVTAEAQATMYDTLLSGAAGVTTTEQQLLSSVCAQASRWPLRKRFNTREAAEAYWKATAFEALIGHLHINDPDRLAVLAEALLQQSASDGS